jgi:hypothetical protein
MLLIVLNPTKEGKDRSTPWRERFRCPAKMKCNLLTKIRGHIHA